MRVIYHERYNINLGLLNYLHPFHGTKFNTIYQNIKDDNRIKFVTPADTVSMEIIDEFLTTLMRRKIRDSVFIFRALEVPRLPFVSFSYLDRKILTPMRWGVAGTLYGAKNALTEGGIYWNLAGGYHHAFPQNMEGFCIYNDIGICYQQLVKQGSLSKDDKILIIDTDAHHGNGNSYTFMDTPQVTLLDVYNAGIYPTSGYTRDRVNTPYHSLLRPRVPLTFSDIVPHYLSSMMIIDWHLSLQARIPFSLIN